MSSASLTMVKTLEKALLVLEESKPRPHYWKLPGGGCSRGESPKQCASRELYEETGVNIPPEELAQFKEYQRPDGHIVYAFVAQVVGMPEHLDVGNGGEIVKEFSIPDVLRMLRVGEILPEQSEMIKQMIVEYI